MPGEGSAEYLPDGLLIVEDGHVAACGPFERLVRALPEGTHITRHERSLIVPGFVDAHVHFPQLDMIAAPGGRLLDWLERHTFPAEAAFADPDHARAMAGSFLDALIAHGTTTALVFASVHAHSVDALNESALMRDMRLISGKVLMDRGAPDALLEPAAAGYEASRALIGRWRGRGRLGYAVAPRFAPSCSEESLASAGRLLGEHPDVLMQTHLAENNEEIALVGELFPEARDYLEVYERAGLVGPRSVFAHCVHLDDDARARLARAGAGIAFCPGSNLFLGSGLFDLAAAREDRVRIGLGSDVGAGTSLSLLAAMGEAWKVGQLLGHPLDPFEGFRMATIEGARLLGLGEKIGNFEPGKEADFLVLDLMAPPLLARRVAGCRTLGEILFALTILGDDRSIGAVYLRGKLSGGTRCHTR